MRDKEMKLKEDEEKRKLNKKHIKELGEYNDEDASSASANQNNLKKKKKEACHCGCLIY